MGSGTQTLAGHRERRAELFVIDARSGQLNLATLREVWAFREVLGAFIVRRVKVRYRQAAFGVGWVVLQPLAFAAVFAVFLGHLAHVSSSGVPYFLFALTGLALWMYFAETVTGAIQSLVAEAGVIRKLYFPREIPPLAVVAAMMVDASVSLVVLLIVIVATGYRPNILWLFLPLLFLIVAIPATGAGLLLAGFNVYYRDVSYGLPFLIQLGFFLTPVIYPTTLVPPAFRTWYEILNPIAGAIQGMRNVLLFGRPPDVGILGLAVVWALLTATGAYAVFKRIEGRFADSV